MVQIYENIKKAQKFNVFFKVCNIYLENIKEF